MLVSCLQLKFGSHSSHVFVGARSMYLCAIHGYMPVWENKEPRDLTPPPAL